MGYSAKSDNNSPHKSSSSATCEQSEAWQRYVAKHGGVKSYAHFDKRTSLRNPKVQDMVCDPQWVASHGFLPFIQFNDDGRTISYAAHLDCCIYHRYSFLLNEKYESYALQHGFSDAAIAYRSELGKSNIDFAKQAFDFIKDLNSKDSSALIFVSDFSQFFESIRHDLLKEKLCKVLGVTRLERDFYQVFKSVTKYAYWGWDDIYNIRLYCKNRALTRRVQENALAGVKASSNSKKSISPMKSLLDDILTKEQEQLIEQADILSLEIGQLNRAYDWHNHTIDKYKRYNSTQCYANKARQLAKEVSAKLTKATAKLKEIEQRKKEISLLLQGLAQNKISVDWADSRSPYIPNAVDHKAAMFLSRREMNASERILAPHLFKGYKRSYLHKHEDNKGIPQGASISAVLANVYMIDFDQTLNDYVKRKGGLYLRYCDDFIVILPLNPYDTWPSDLAEAISALREQGLDSLWETHLCLHGDKTHKYVVQDKVMVEIDDSGQKEGKASLNFLGFSFDGKGVKVDPALIDKYNKGMRLKAKAIVDCDFTTKYNNHINCRELYRLYSGVTGEVNFVSYLKRCARTMELDDPKALDIIKNNKRNIANTLNRLKRKRAQALAAAQKKRARELFPEIFKK